VPQLTGLEAKNPGEIRVGMTQVAHGDASEGIEITFAVLIP